MIEKLSEQTRAKLQEAVELRRQAAAASGAGEAVIAQIVALGQQLAALPSNRADLEAAARAAENDLLDLVRAEVALLAAEPA
jgi:hypothetical protein